MQFDTDSRMRTLEFGTTEVLEDVLPIRWVVILAQVGLQFA